MISDHLAWGSSMATDFYAMLSHAVSTLEPGVEDGRHDIYSRARQAVAELRPGTGLSLLQISAEAAALENAIRQIEEEILKNAVADPSTARSNASPGSCFDEGAAGDGSRRSAGIAPEVGAIRAERRSGITPPARFAIAGLAAVAMAIFCGAVYLYLNNNISGVSRGDRQGPVSEAVGQPGNDDDRLLASAGELDPGIDGSSSTAGLPFYYRRQPVFYRTAIVPGTIVIDRSQRFLYVIEPNSVAQRYGIGISRDCVALVGMLHVSRKVEWPEWRAPDEVIRRRPDLIRSMAGGPGNPLGARAIYLSGTVRIIHGTNAPQTIGHLVSLGCIRLVNEDIIDLYNRVSLETRVVMRN